MSLSTASRSVRGLPGITETLAARVRKTADDLGYVANAHAQTLTGGSLPIVGLIVPEIDDPYFVQLAAGVVGAAAERDLMVQVALGCRGVSALRALVAQQVRAIIMAGSSTVDREQRAVEDALLATFERNGGHAVIVGERRRGLDAVEPDHRGAGRAAARYLAELGHTQVAIIGVTGTDGDRARDLLEGALEGFRLAGVRSRVARHEHWSSEVGAVAVSELRTSPATTALLVVPEDSGADVVASVGHAGLSVPEDVSVVGFESVASASSTQQPRVTTMTLRPSDVGRVALDVAVRRPAARPRRKTLAAELSPGDSAGPPHA